MNVYWYIHNHTITCTHIDTDAYMAMYCYSRYTSYIASYMLLDHMYTYSTCIHIHTLFIQACKLAMDEGWAVNLGGGFGYNTTQISKGLAVYDDIPVCLAVSCNHSYSVSKYP